MEERRKVDGTGFVRWLRDWLDERMQSRPATAAPAPGEIAWSELREMLDPQGLGVYFTIMSLAAGRAYFELHPDELLSLLAMSCERFDAITKRLVELGLIDMAPCGESVQWRVVRQPAQAQ